MPGGVGCVELRLDTGTPEGAAGRFAHLSVIDNGSGMDLSTQARVVEPFFTTKASGEGTGLGLSLVHGIVASHSGVITLSSQPGFGSRFDLYFLLLGDIVSATTITPFVTASVRGSGQHVL